jgi:hypothetical protein
MAPASPSTEPPHQQQLPSTTLFAAATPTTAKHRSDTGFSTSPPSNTISFQHFKTERFRFPPSTAVATASPDILGGRASKCVQERSLSRRRVLGTALALPDFGEMETARVFPTPTTDSGQEPRAISARRIILVQNARKSATAIQISARVTMASMEVENALVFLLN